MSWQPRTSSSTLSFSREAIRARPAAGPCTGLAAPCLTTFGSALAGFALSFGSSARPAPGTRVTASMAIDDALQRVVFIRACPLLDLVQQSDLLGELFLAIGQVDDAYIQFGDALGQLVLSQAESG